MAAMVKSVEFLEYTFTTTSGDVSLTKGQDYTNCVPFMTLHGGGDYMYHKFTDVYFGGTTESGVITFKRASTYSNTNIKCFVVEFEPSEIKVQQGSFDTLPGNTVTAYNTPESFDQTKTAMVHYWSSSSSVRYWGAHLIRGRVLANGTQVDMYRYHGNGSVFGHYFLFEDISTGNDHLLVNHQDVSTTSASLQRKIPSSQRDVTRTFQLGSYTTTDTGAGYAHRQTARIFSYFNSFARCDRAEGTGTLYCAVQNVTFLDTSRVYVAYQLYTGFSSGNSTITSNWQRPVNSLMATIIPSIPMGQMRGSSSSASEIDQLFCSMKFNSTTQAQFQKNSTGYANYFNYSVIDWGGAIVNNGTNPSPIDPDISFVKSVENFRIDVAGYQEHQDLSKGQDASNCALFVTQRCQGGGNEIRESLHDVYLREPGVVVAHRTDGSGNGYVDVSVVEFYGDQVKIQQGNWTMWSATTATKDIEAVSDLSKAFVMCKWESNDGTWWSRANVRTRFTTTSGLEFYRNDAGNIIGGTFFVVEDLGDNFDVTHSITSSTSTTQSHWDYTPNRHSGYYNAIPLCSYATTEDNYYCHRACCRIYSLGDGGRTICNRNEGTGTCYASFQFVRFLDERDHLSQMAPTHGTSTNLSTQALRSVYVDNRNISVGTFNPNMISTGRSNGSGSDDMRGVFHTYRLINDNMDIEMSRGTAAGMTLYPSYGGAIDWVGYSHPLADEKHELNRAYPTKSLVRSMEKFEYVGTSRIHEYYLTKGQIPENCVPFASWRVGCNDYYMDRLAYHQYIDKNSRVTSLANGGGNSGDPNETVYVVEFDPDQVRVQQIFQLMTGTSYNVDIPIEVDLEKTFMWFSYTTDNWARQWRYHLVTGSFLSSTELNFARNVSSNGVYLTIYLIECLQDQWHVTRYDGGTDSDTNSYDTHYFKYDSSHRLVQGSYSIDNSNYYCDRSCYRLYNNHDHPYQIQWNRNNSSGNQTDRHTEVLQFNPDIGARTFITRIDMTNPDTSEVKRIGNIDDVDMDRSMVCPVIVNCVNRVDGTGTDDPGQVCVRLEITDPLNATFTRYNKGVYTYGHAQFIEWPEYKTHYFEGNVTERAVPIERTVSCFRSDTNELMASTVSASGTGFYHLETTYSGAHYIVCQDDDPPTDYNHLVLGKMNPYPLPTFSGGEIVYG